MITILKKEREQVVLPIARDKWLNEIKRAMYRDKFLEITGDKYPVPAPSLDRWRRIRAGGEDHLLLLGRSRTRAFDDIRDGIIRDIVEIDDSGGVSVVRRGGSRKDVRRVGPVRSYPKRISRARLISDTAHVSLLTHAQ